MIEVPVYFSRECTLGGPLVMHSDDLPSDDIPFVPIRRLEQIKEEWDGEGKEGNQVATIVPIEEELA